MLAFNPQPTVNITATTTTGNVSLGEPANAAPGGTVRVFSAAGNPTIFIGFGTSAVTATLAASMPIAGGTIEVFEIPGAATYAAAITASGTGTIYFTPGRGT